jgi:hypothetical protein
MKTNQNTLWKSLLNLLSHIHAPGTRFQPV